MNGWNTVIRPFVGMPAFFVPPGRGLPMSMWLVGRVVNAPVGVLPYQPVGSARVVGLIVVGWLVMASVAFGAEPDETATTTSTRIAQLIAQLGDPDYFVRERAQQQLEQIGFEAFDALQSAASHEDLEIAARARYLLRLLRADLTRPGDPPEVKQLLADYDTLSPAQRRERIERLAEMPDGRGAEAVVRLVQYERAVVLSKWAALALIRNAATDPPQGAAAERLRESVRRTSRTPGQWLLAWLDWPADSARAAERWNEFVEAEFRLHAEGSSETTAEIVGSLLKIQFLWLERLQRTDEAMAVAERLTQLPIDEPETLLDLSRWLIARKAWVLIEQLAQRNSETFSQRPVLAYIRAWAAKQSGDRPRAEQLAEQARSAAPGRELQALVEHMRTAIQLRQLGLFEWAEGEFRHVVGQLPAVHPLSANARFALAEMLHDQGDNARAAQTLSEVLEAVGGDKPGAMLADRSTAEIASRMHYFFACDAEQKGLRDRQKDHLLKGLAPPEPDIDLLIMAHHFPDLSPEQRSGVAAKIKQIADELAEDIAQNPDNPSFLNQYAWLVGNTTTDRQLLETALKHSQRSLQLSPNNAGYLDTLAHVYAAMGDYRRAVEYQSQAAKLEPHSGLIAKKLELFRNELRRRESSR